MLKRKTKGKEAEKAEEIIQVVGFRVGKELYGLNITTIREIDKMQPITKLPKALPFVEGVINLRNSIIPVIDLAKRFGLPPISPGRQTRIIIARLAGQSVGLVVDQVTEVHNLEASSIEPPPPLAFDIDHRYVQGVGRIKEELIIILNLDRLLSTEEVSELQQHPLA